MRVLTRCGLIPAAKTLLAGQRRAVIPIALRRSLLGTAAILVALVAGTRGTQDAAANGDTRSISIIHEHTKESATITFKRDGRYDRQALDQLNWLLRDWRLDEQIKMEPKLFDAVWEVYRSVGAQEPIHVVSAYRSPETNAALRRRSRRVAEHSQHMLGRAMDFYLPDVSVDALRAAGMRLQNGGVGWYPNAFNPFVHIDAGSVRHWPRMSHDQLARLFPDGKTVHMPTDNKPLDRYDEAKAEVLARGGTVLGYTQYASAEESVGGGKSLWQMLFGGGEDEDSSYYGLNNGGAGRSKPTRQPPPSRVQVASANSEDAGTRGIMAYAAAPSDAIDPLRPSLLRGGRSMRAAEAPAAPAAVEPPAVSDASAAPAAAKTMQPPSDIASAVMPLPPRRPEEFAALALAVATMTAPLPPVRPRAVMVASADDSVMPSVLRLRQPLEPEPARRHEPPADDRAQLRALFNAAAGNAAPSRAAPVKIAAARAAAHADLPTGSLSGESSGIRQGFAARGSAGDLTASRFSGSAVKALPTR